MSTSNTITSNYAGEKAAGYIAAALFSGKTLSEQNVTILPGIKKQQALRILDVSSIMDDASCDWDPTGTVTLSDRLITPKELQVNIQLCKKDYRAHWEALQMGAGIWDSMPSDFTQFLLAEVLAQVGEAIELAFWAGTDTTGSFPGIETLIAADADLPAAQEVSGTTVNAGNVITELGSCADAVPNRVYMKDDGQFYVAANIWRAYNRALGGFGAAGLGANGFRGEGTVGQKPLDFDGKPIVVCEGMNANTMIYARKSNLYFGTDLMADSNEVKLIDTTDILNDQNVRLAVRFTAAAQYALAEEMTTYGITNGAN